MQKPFAEVLGFAQPRFEWDEAAVVVVVGLSSTTCPLKGATVAPAFLARVFFDQFLDQTRCLEFVEDFDRDVEPFPGQIFDFGFVEPVLINNLEDEVFLSRTALPDISAFLTPTISVTVAVPITVTISVADLTWQITDFLDITVHALLQDAIQPGALLLNLRYVRKFGFEADAELMAAVVGQADLL